jgi:hypothetical protein
MYLMVLIENNFEAWSRQEKPEARGLEKSHETRCCDPVGESDRAQVPPDERRAIRSGANPTCSTSHGGAERGGARWQASGLRPEIGLVVDSRISLRGMDGKADGFHASEGSSPGFARVSASDTTGV